MGETTVTIAWHRLGGQPSATDAALDAHEAARSQAMRNPARRAQFIAGRLLLQEVLRGRLGEGRHIVTVEAEGPPRLRDWPDMHLAVAHSGGIVAVAAADAPIGLDLEQLRRPRDIEGIAALCCDATEHELLQAVPAALRQLRLHQLWTVKEAWLKRHGEGMAPRRMAQIHVRPVLDATAADVRTWGGDDWCLALAAWPESHVRWHAAGPASQGLWAVRDEAALSPACVPRD